MEKQGAIDSLHGFAPTSTPLEDRASRTHRKTRDVYHSHGKSRPFLIFPPLAGISAMLVFPHAGATVTLGWVGTYLTYLLVRSISQRHDLARHGGWVPWNHAKISATTNAALFGALIPLTFDRLPLTTQLQFTAILVLAVVTLSAVRFNLPTVTRIYHGLILLPLALAWPALQPDYWGIGAFIVAVMVTSEVIAYRARKYWRHRVELELDKEELIAERANQIRQLEMLQKSRTEHLIAACHDLRQPAHAMSLSIAAALIETPEGPLKDLMHGLQRSNTVLSEMLISLMDLARLESGFMQADAQAVRLDALFEDIRQQFALLASHKGLVLHVEPCDLSMHSDPYLLRRIVFNLVSNAIKFTPSGDVGVRAVARGDGVALVVSDTGVGIPLAQQAHVFEPYARLNPSTEGMGIGLTVVKRACALLGHDLKVDSSPAGTSVSIAGARGRVDPQPATETRVAQSPRCERGAAADRLLVAVLEDDAASRTAMVHLLEGWGYRVVSAESPVLLNRALGTDKLAPDVLLADVQLGFENGVVAATGLRRQPGLEHLPVILVTGDIEPQTLASARELGFALMHKPVRPSALQEALAAVESERSRDDG